MQLMGSASIATAENLAKKIIQDIKEFIKESQIA